MCPRDSIEKLEFIFVDLSVNGEDSEFDVVAVEESDFYLRYNLLRIVDAGFEGSMMDASSIEMSIQNVGNNQQTYPISPCKGPWTPLANVWPKMSAHANRSVQLIMHSTPSFSKFLLFKVSLYI
jgi:hypothetical protein